MYYADLGSSTTPQRILATGCSFCSQAALRAVTTFSIRDEKPFHYNTFVALTAMSFCCVISLLNPFHEPLIRARK